MDAYAITLYVECNVEGVKVIPVMTVDVVAQFDNRPDQAELEQLMYFFVSFHRHPRLVVASVAKVEIDVSAFIE